MRDISAKELRKEVVNNIENCENFKNVFEMIFESNYEKFSEFKTKHLQEGEFTDEDGVMALATGYYLGVTLRIFSRTNTKKQPYTEHNENQPIIFNIFLDDRTSNSEHFQSLKQPEMEIAKDKQKMGLEKRNTETIRSTEEVMDDFLKMYYNEQEVAETVNEKVVSKEKSDPNNKISNNKVSKKENGLKTEINDKEITEQTKKEISKEKSDLKNKISENNINEQVKKESYKEKNDINHEFNDNKIREKKKKKKKKKVLGLVPPL